MKATFWNIYTPENIYYEIRNRAGILKKRLWPTTDDTRSPVYSGDHALAVGAFYDTWHDKFMAAYGPVIQAFRTKNIEHLLAYQMESIGLKTGQKVLDAGCGTATPAIYFAQKLKLEIDAITISSVQFEVALKNTEKAGLTGVVRPVCGDYHLLGRYLPKAAYDVVYFLESFGHSTSKKVLIDACWDALKPGGTLYIKDLFRKIPIKKSHEKKINAEIKKINQAYHYEIADLNELMDIIRGKGFILSSLKTIDLSLDSFENLAISNEFQELTGIACIDDWDTYIFPVDFFEMRCTKPELDLETRMDRYFLQNLYYMQSQSE